ncbi:MAG: PilZ domain-containing protein [bacterium]
MNEMSGDSRRAYERLDFETPVTVLADGRTVAGTCRNISQGGMFLEAGEAVAIGSAVRVRFALPDLKGDGVDAEATVRWCERDGASSRGLGLQFSGLRPIEVWAINQLFRKRSRGA